MDFKEINKKYTEKIMEYLNKGYTINAGTMSGTQGEIARTDLTDGKDIIRIRISRFHEGSFGSTIGYKINEGKCTDGIKANDDEYSRTLWDNHLEIISSEKFYEERG